ncbi:MAG: hypothetical protein ACREL1_09435, partial [bacterium]
QRLLAENQQFLPLGTSLKNWLTFPWRLLMPSGGGGAQFVGPLILSFMPLSLPALAREGAPRFWAGTALVYLGLGLCFSHMLRFVMLAFVLLLMAWTVWAARAKGPWEKSVTVWGLLGALLAPPYFLAISARYFDGIGFLTGAESRVQYLERMVRNPYEDLARWTDTHLPSNARLLLVGDTRGLYYQRDFLANSAFEEPFLAAIARTSASPAQMAEKVRRLGVTDAVVNIPEGIRLGEDYHLYRLSPVQWARLNRYLALYWKPLYFNHFHAVYEIEDEPQKSPGPSVAPMNPFSFFAQPAYDFSRAAQAKRGSAVLAAVRAETALFPEDPFWVQKRAWAEKAFGVRSKKRG